MECYTDIENYDTDMTITRQACLQNCHKNKISQIKDKINY